MKVITLLLLISLIFSPACAAEEEFSPGAFLADLLLAYEEPSEENYLRVCAEEETLTDPVLRAVGEHWKRVYLDPDYTLYMLGRDDPAVLTLPDEGAGHAFAVLGYQLVNGEMTPELKGRCDAAAAAASAFPESILICSGGATGGNNPERHTEAGMMRDYLIRECGIAANRIYTDEEAMTTAQNAINTFAILRALGIRTVTVVTSAYHQRWGQVLYNAVSAQCALEYGCEIRLVGNYCFDTEPGAESFRQDARYALYQLCGILDLPQEERSLISRPGR